jgi:hypothetical protein
MGGYMSNIARPISKPDQRFGIGKRVTPAKEFSVSLISDGPRKRNCAAGEECGFCRTITHGHRGYGTRKM